MVICEKIEPGAVASPSDKVSNLKMLFCADAYCYDVGHAKLLEKVLENRVTQRTLLNNNLQILYFKYYLVLIISEYIDIY